MITRYFINGVFLFVLYVLLFHNPTKQSDKEEMPKRSFSYLFTPDIHPDTIIRHLKNEHLLVSEMNEVLQRVQQDSLAETMNGLAIMYGVCQKAQLKVDAGESNTTLDQVIATLAQYKLIVYKQKSNWTKFKEYFQDCVFKNVRCDHLINRVTRHEYFPAALVFCSLILLASIFLIFKKKITILLQRFKLRQNETIDHTIPFNPGNQ